MSRTHVTRAGSLEFTGPHQMVLRNWAVWMPSPPPADERREIVRAIRDFLIEEFSTECGPLAPREEPREEPTTPPVSIAIEREAEMLTYIAINQAQRGDT